MKGLIDKTALKAIASIYGVYVLWHILLFVFGLNEGKLDFLPDFIITGTIFLAFASFPMNPFNFTTAELPWNGFEVVIGIIEVYLVYLLLYKFVFKSSKKAAITVSFVLSYGLNISILLLSDIGTSFIV